MENMKIRNIEKNFGNKPGLSLFSTSARYIYKDYRFFLFLYIYIFSTRQT